MCINDKMFKKLRLENNSFAHLYKKLAHEFFVKKCYLFLTFLEIIQEIKKKI